MCFFNGRTTTIQVPAVPPPRPKWFIYSSVVRPKKEVFFCECVFPYNWIFIVNINSLPKIHSNKNKFKGDVNKNFLFNLLKVYLLVITTEPKWEIPFVSNLFYGRYRFIILREKNSLSPRNKTLDLQNVDTSSVE